MAHNTIIREHPANVPVPTEEPPHACMDGWVFLGFEGEDENGELLEEVIEAVRCRRCAESL